MVHGLIKLSEKLKSLVANKCTHKDFSDALDKFIIDGGNLNEKIYYEENQFKSEIKVTFISQNIELFNRSPEALRLFIDKGGNLDIDYSYAIENEYYNLVPILLDGKKITREDLKWIKARCQKHIDSSILDRALEKAYIREDYVEKPVRMVMEVQPDSLEAARAGMCVAIHSLSADIRDGDTSSFKITPYLLPEEINKAQKYKVISNGDYSFVSHKNPTIDTITRAVYVQSPSVAEKKSDAIFSDLIKKEQAEQVLNIVNKALEDMAYCLGIKKDEISVSVRSMGLDQSYLDSWHRDGIGLGNPGFRATLAIKGDGTMFAFDSDNISQGSEVKGYFPSPGGALSIFSSGGKRVVHKTPIVIDSRIVVVFDCDECLTEITHNNLVQRVAEGIAPVIKESYQKLLQEEREELQAYIAEKQPTELKAQEDLKPLEGSSNLLVKLLKTEDQAQDLARLTNSGAVSNQPNLSNSYVQSFANQAILALSLGVAPVIRKLSSVFQNEVNQDYNEPRQEEYKSLDQKLQNLANFFKRKNNPLLELESLKVLKTLNEFNQQPHSDDTKALTEQAKIIFKRYKKLQQEANDIVNKKSKGGYLGL